MATRKLTNILLLLIFSILVIKAFFNFWPREAVAETFKLDNCITVDPYDQPGAYVHVVVHNVSPIQSASDLR